MSNVLKYEYARRKTDRLAKALRLRQSAGKLRRMADEMSFQAAALERRCAKAPSK